MSARQEKRCSGFTVSSWGDKSIPVRGERRGAQEHPAPRGRLGWFGHAATLLPWETRNRLQKNPHWKNVLEVVKPDGQNSGSVSSWTRLGLLLLCPPAMQNPSPQHPGAAAPARSSRGRDRPCSFVKMLIPPEAHRFGFNLHMSYFHTTSVTPGSTAPYVTHTDY